MNRPDPAALAEEFRNMPAAEFADGVISDFVDEAAKLQAKTGGPRIKRSAMALCFLRAFEDARQLDANAEKAGRAAVFLRAFLDSVFCAPGFLDALIEISRLPLDQKAFGPVLTALTKKQDARAAHLLVLFRETMKDGWSADDALRQYGRQIGRELAKGNVWLLRQIAEASKARYSRNLYQRWILRGWLPLALWQAVDISEHERRLKAAWEVTKAAGVALPEWPAEPSAENPYPLGKLLAKARSSIKLGRR